MPPRKVTGRRKKPSPATAVSHNESPTLETETRADAAVVKVKEEKKTEASALVEASDPNPAENDGDSTKGVSVSSESMVKEEMVLEDVNVASNENGEPDGSGDKDKEELRKGSEDVDEGRQGVGSGKGEAAEKELAQEETASKVDNFKAPNASNTSLVVKGDLQGEEIAEVISGQESNVTILFSKESTQAVSTKRPSENDATLAFKDDSKNGDDEEGDDDSEEDEVDSEGNEDPSPFVEDPLTDNKKDKDIDEEESEGDEEPSLFVEGPLTENKKDKDLDEEDSEGDEDPSLFVEDPHADNKKDKDLEIYVGGLNKNTVEDDLVNVFQQFGELKSTRIVRNSTTKKSKGFAFVRFASVDHARRALSELKDGVEVKGKNVKISASQDNDTLYLGNICKTWTKEEVLQQLKQYGIEHVEVIRLPEDPKGDGKIKGFAFLEFGTHSDAVAAFQRLRKPDAIFGRDVSAKVAFAQAPPLPSDEVLSQVKRVYVEGLTKAWNEERVKEVFKQYGEIVKINLCQNSGTKHKEFGFVTFTSHENAIACVEGINNADIGGDVKLKASIAKPQQKSKLQKQGFRGGFKVEKQSEASPLKKDAESSKVKGGLNSQQAKKKEASSSSQKINANTVKPKKKGPLEKQNSHVGLNPSKKDPESSKEPELSKKARRKRERKAAAELNSKIPSELRYRGLQGTPKKSKKNYEGQNSKTTSKEGSRKRKNISNYEGHEDRSNRNANSKRPFKKQKGNIQGGERGDTHVRKGHHDYRNRTRYADPHATKYAASGSYHLGPDSIATSTRHYTEMEPHAGYIEPTSAKQGRSYSGYVHQPVVRTHNPHQTVYLEPSAGSQSQLHSRYADRPVVTQSHRGYFETAGAGVPSYRGYHQSAIVQVAHDPYSPGLGRVVRDDGRGTSGLAYVGGPALPAAQVRSHTSYAGYRAGSSYSGSYGPQRSYY